MYPAIILIPILAGASWWSVGKITNDWDMANYALIAVLAFGGFLLLRKVRRLRVNLRWAGVALLAIALSGSTLVPLFSEEVLLPRVLSALAFMLATLCGILLVKSESEQSDDKQELQEARTQLTEARTKLKELDTMKSRFISMASNDLRAPLSVIKNFISLVLEGTYGKIPQSAEEGLRQVFDRTTDMTKSVEAYLNVSRINEGSTKYEFITVELLPLVKNAVSAFGASAAKKGLTLNALYDPALEGVKARLDVAKINEVLNNFLDNSIKYSLKGSIEVATKKIGGVARITVKDTGVGMSQETVSKLFQLFSTADDSRKVNVASTGVGLYITKAHVEAHGGKVWAESEGEGKGSTFILELPLVA